VDLIRNLLRCYRSYVSRTRRNLSVLARVILAVLSIERNRLAARPVWTAVVAQAAALRQSPVMVRPALVLCLSLLASCALFPTDHEGAGAPREAAIVPLRAERPLVALALGSGGARGFAHVGVIKALEEAGIVPDIVTGSSSGAVVAALYAGGHDARGLERIALEVEKGDLVDFVLLGKGWVRGEALQDFVNRMVGERPIERLARPLAVVATQSKSGRMTVFNHGDTGLAVRASASVPNLFVPPVIRGEEYVDGGLSSPVPVKLARAMGADVVIAVDVSWFAQARDASGDGMRQHGRSGRYALLADEIESADVVIVPRTARTRMLDFEQKAANIAAGEAAGREALPRLRERLALAARNSGRRD
jgi:NTE family protein